MMIDRSEKPDSDDQEYNTHTRTKERHDDDYANST